MLHSIPYRIRIFSDGSARGDKGSWAWSIKDYHTDRTLALGAEVQSGIRNSFHAEALGILAGLQALPIYRQVEVCTDQESIVNAFETGRIAEFLDPSYWAVRPDKAYLGQLWTALAEESSRHIVDYRWLKRSSWPGMRECDKLAHAFLDRQVGSKLLDVGCRET